MATTEAALMRVLAGEPKMIRFRPRKAEVADDRCLPMFELTAQKITSSVTGAEAAVGWDVVGAPISGAVAEQPAGSALRHRSLSKAVID